MFLFKRSSTNEKVTDKNKTRKIDNNNQELSYRIGNLQKVGSRDSQEDSFAVLNALDVNEIAKNGLFAIIADGMGGMKDGKLVSEAAVEEFIWEFHNIDRDLDIPKQLADSAIRINQLLNDKFQGDGGTTAVLVMIYKGLAYWLSIGDSAIYLKRNGGLYQLNQVHTYLNELYLAELYKEKIDKLSLESDINATRLSEFLGNSSIDKMDYNLKPLILKDEDVLFLCSDGISSFLEESVIARALSYPPEAACNILQAALDAQADTNLDNYTSLIISCLK